MFGDETIFNLTYLVLGGETLHSESETNLVLGRVTHKLGELSLVSL